MKIGELLKRRRKELRLSAEFVAEKCGVNPATVYRWESGYIGNIPSSKIKILSELLQISPSVIVGELSEEEKSSFKVALPNPETTTLLPIYGDISCGNGLFVDDNIVDYFTIPSSLLPFKNGDYFAQYAEGDSMIGAGIFEGDLIVFIKSPNIENGQIGCFCIDENMATCKKFSQRDGQIFLLPANDAYQPIFIDPLNTLFHVVGVMVLKVNKVE